jgi:chromodomain-helicase-DNA-binding protein 1
MDEAHRLKNHESALYQELMTWHFKNTLLVTGTPLQNSLQELWALLHFLEPPKFHDREAFVEKHSLDSDQGIASLHRELGPHLLRRVIKVSSSTLVPHSCYLLSF